jgi:hypothetical protein
VPFILYNSADRDNKISNQRAYCEKDALEAGIVVDEGAQLMDRFIRGAAS